MRPTRSATDVSIHAPRAGGDAAICNARRPSQMFQSTPPARGATANVESAGLLSRSFNPRPPRGGRRRDQCVELRHVTVSIHAPRAGGDVHSRRGSQCTRVSIHAPRAGGDVPRCSTSPRKSFQSTLPARGATTSMARSAGHRAFQSTLPARGATRDRADCDSPCVFQSTLPARGATLSDCAYEPACDAFQSTLPARGATLRADQRLHGECFNPRSPRGGRRARCRAARSIDVSIHAPRAGGDVGYARPIRAHVFQSTLPARGATMRSATVADCESVSIHAPRAGSDA